MGIYVVRAFLRLREMLASNTQLARQFLHLEARLDKKLAHHDEAIAAISLGAPPAHEWAVPRSTSKRPCLLSFSYVLAKLRR